MADEPLEYVLPQALGTLRLEGHVVAHLLAHRQNGLLKAEAGGQLFAQLTPELIHVVEATGPRRTDRQSVFGYVPDRKAEQREITERYPKGLHFVGDWHSHRQKYPRPSETDRASIIEMFQRSDHGLPGFFLAIIGTAPLPRGLYLGFYMGRVYYELAPKAV